MTKEKQEIESKDDNNIEIDISEEKKQEEIENKIDPSTAEKTAIIQNVKYTRPPAFVKGNNQFRGSQNNFAKSIQRKSSGRGR